MIFNQKEMIPFFKKRNGNFSSTTEKNRYFLFAVLIISILGCAIPIVSQSKDVEPDIYSCFMDPEVNELMQHAVNLKDYKKSNEILFELLGIRPNCIDLHKAIAGNFAFQNDLKNFQKYNNKAQFLQTEYDMKSGKYYNRIEKKLNENSKPKRIYTEPPDTADWTIGDGSTSTNIKIIPKILQCKPKPQIIDGKQRFFMISCSP